MHMFILDFAGTLTTLKDPVEYVVRLKQRHAGSKVVLYTGNEVDEIRQQCPGLLEVVDDLWPKPHSIMDKMQGMTLRRLTIVDDERDMLSAMRRFLRKHPIPQIDFLEPAALLGLLAE